MTRIGLLGGTFDPVHKAHIALAHAARQALGLDSVELLPAADPWQRGPLATTSSQRLEMLQLALASHPELRINTVELERGGKTYTIDTVSQLPQGPRYYWILGSDQLQNFCTWHRWQDIVRHVELAVAQRPDSPLDTPAELARHLGVLDKEITIIPIAPLTISASEIRQHIAVGMPVDAFLDDAVAAYIARHDLYHPTPD